MKLVYVSDPMCSWCYGFGKEMTELTRQQPDLELDIVVGGLRAGATDVLDDAGKQFRLTHWARVEASSGLPFNREALLARKGFVYDTEPICRAVVAARKVAPQADMLSVFRALQRAFYVDGLDTTDGRVLAKTASIALEQVGHLIHANSLFQVWSAADTIAETNADFVRARQLGVSSFPALLLQKENRYVEVSAGYAPVSELEQRLRNAMSKLASNSVET